MTALLLLAGTACVLVLPLWPALREWRRPRDVVPLAIDSDDALAPPALAQRFVTRLVDALARGDAMLGSTPIARATREGGWPLTDEEQRTRRSLRVWHLPGGGTLPAGTSFHAEVAASGELRTAPGASYRALWSGRRLHLAQDADLLRWAQGRQVDVASRCRLRGRVCADERLVLADAVSFTLLYAPRIEVLGLAPPVPALPEALNDAHPSGVEWEPAPGRGRARGALDLGPARWWRGDLVVQGALAIGPCSLVEGGLKARGALCVGAGTRLHGPVVAEGPIAMGQACVVQGVIVSETAVTLDAGCVVGTPERPATVCAPRVHLGPGVVVHGTVWATRSGRTTAAQAATPAQGQAQTLADTPAPSPMATTPPPDLQSPDLQPPRSIHA